MQKEYTMVSEEWIQTDESFFSPAAVLPVFKDTLQPLGAAILPHVGRI
jgi:hypothetical protein